MLSTSNDLPLAGVRVLELAEGWAGPMSGKWLGDLGAEVIKVEAIQRYDHSRGPVKPPDGLPGYPNKKAGPRPYDVNSPFVAANTNKYAITIDLSRPKGVVLFKRMVPLTDVVLTNMVTGVPEKMGIGYEELVKIKRDLIMLISSGYGASGPYARRVTMGGAMDGIAGFSWLRHYADQSPDTATYSMHTDVVTSMNNSLAIMMAIYHRWATGKGLLVETSGVEASLHQIPAALMDYALNGRVRVSTGNEDPNGVMAPHNVYPCKGTDAWVTITVTNESQWRSLVRAMGSPEWSQAPRFATMHSRWTHREELDKHIAAWTRTQDKHAAMHTLQETGVPAGAVYDQRDHATDPQWKARGVYQPTQISTAGQYPLATSPWTMDGKRIGIRKPPPGIGQDNEYVFTELMGLRRAEIEALRKEQYIGDKPLELEV